MRIKNSIRNAIVGMIYYLSTFILSFISKTFFINYLGNQYNGLNGLFSNIITMLSIAELGIGSAIVFHLYKPILNNDIEQIKSLMKLYKKVYNFIVFLLIVLGLLCLPFLNFFVNNEGIKENIHVLFMLYILGSSATYLFTYSRSLIIANQENYIITICDTIYKLALNIFQIMILVVTKNYYFYLVIQILFVIIENYIIHLIAISKYPFLKDKNIKKLDTNLVKDIILKVKGLLYYKIGGQIINGTDNIIISMFCGLNIVGYYSNYLMIITFVTTLISYIISSATASVGNLIAENNKIKMLNTYNNMLFIQYYICGIAYVILYNILPYFIQIWIGKEYLLNDKTLILIILNHFIASSGLVTRCFKEGAGIYYEDRMIPIIEAIINLGISILLGRRLGLDGVLLGTILSCMIRYLYSYPKYIYRNIVENNMKAYYKTQGIYCIITFFGFCICKKLCNTMSLLIQNNFLIIITNAVIIIFLYTLFYYCLFRNKSELQYYKNLIIRKFR